MKAALHTALLALAALSLPTMGQGQDVYIRYDSTCMDRMEYAYGFTVRGTEYVKYQVQLSPTEYIVLEVGPENSAQVQQGFSDPTLQCGDIRLNAELAGNIREGRTKAFMVRPLEGNQFAVMRINQASYFRRDGQGVTYESWQFSFSHQGGLRVGENLTEDNVQGVNVFYQGPTTYQCADAFIFRQTFQFASPDAYREIIFVPGIGIVEERPANGDANNIYQLKWVNGQPFDQYLQEKCAEGIQASGDFLLAQGGQNPPPAATDITPFQPQPAGPTIHVVTAGETLFSVSRQHMVGVGDIQSWNNLGSSTVIKVGQELVVSDPSLAAASTGTMNMRGAQQPAWQTTTGTHTVQAGETVATLATMYGYTEARFRDMNNLVAGQALSPGMVLKTTDCPTGTQAPSGQGNEDTTLPTNEPVTQGNQLPAPFSPDFAEVSTNAQSPAGTTTSRGNTQAFAPPNTNTQGTLPTNNPSATNQGNIQPFTPPANQDPTLPTTNNAGTLPTGNNQNSATLPTTTPGTNQNPAGQGNIQPFQPPTNQQPASRGGDQPITPFTPPAGSNTPTSIPTENTTTPPPPASRPPSSSFGTPIRPAGNGATSYRGDTGPTGLSFHSKPASVG